jgi:hypothetical protein
LFFTFFLSSQSLKNNQCFHSSLLSLATAANYLIGLDESRTINQCEGKLL